MSQALAKLYFREEVVQSDVDEAIKLMDYSIKSLNTDNKSIKKPSKKQDEMSSIISEVRELVQSLEPGVYADTNDVLKSLSKPAKMGARINNEKLMATLEHYQELKVIYLDA